MAIINLLTNLVLITIVFQKINACIITSEYEVEIFNGLPSAYSPLTIRCKSKDRDLGYQTLNVNKTFEWIFCENIFGRTLYTCDFRWGNKRQGFQVFNSKTSRDCAGGLCFWLAKSDGFYFKNFFSGLVKKYDWLQ
ncbi:hypothetical protein PHJA_002994400 [Phtheirospermum japonicum]|uniref:S-protein homolog n=1 Tax=Phtheirospermum japonicum TaxID=374723 RepID=A0A830C5X7_9LAMI|nr:hypothetical protein PHJA_001597000 [Phtheirospermum japonicum]GFQ08504.1 hypothetical protein PHJA_002994400 [Phtheirospermum japonicum]